MTLHQPAQGMTALQDSYIERVREYAIHCHESTNHRYGNGEPYSVHLQQVVDVANNYKRLVPEANWERVLAACWCHDVIEDCRQTFNDVDKAIGFTAAQIVYALTNEKGKNRKERANDKYYKGIREIPYATFVKLCDRIANFEYSISTGSRMVEMYKKENDEFINQLHDIQYQDMIDHLNRLAE